jgi:hypothetical protein
MAENIKLLAALDDSDELILLSLCKEDKYTFHGLQIDDLTDEQCVHFFVLQKLILKLFVMPFTFQRRLSVAI